MFAEAQDYMDLSFHGVESLSFFTATGRLCGWQEKNVKVSVECNDMDCRRRVVVGKYNGSLQQRFRVFRVSRGGVSFLAPCNQKARDTLPNSITQSRVGVDASASELNCRSILCCKAEFA